METSRYHQYLEDGYLHLPSFISPKECLSLSLRMRELCERFCPKDYKNTFLAGDQGQSKDEFFLASANKISFFFDPKAIRDGKKRSYEYLNKVGHALHERCPVFNRFARQDKFFNLMTELGQKKSALIQSMFIFKQPLFGDAVPAHQDATFLYTEPSAAIGLWFALEDADEHNSCLWVLPKGHKGPLEKRFMRKGDTLGFYDQKKVRWPAEKFIPIRVKAGDAIVLHGLLPHQSSQNTSNKTRNAITLHFIDKTCHYPKNNWLLSWSGGLEQETK